MRRIALIAGEASGDVLGAGLIEALKCRYPEAQFVGVAGDAMRRAGCEAWFDCSELAVMGLAEVLAHLPRLLRLRKMLRERLLAWQPDVVIGIDAPDFNLGLERWLKQRGIKTVHYVSPSVWAWREKRAAKIGQSADRVLCLFPMEPPIYAAHDVDARFVGHPLADVVALEPDRAAARSTLELPEECPVLALLPGSRMGEIRRLLPVFLDALERIAQAVPELVAVIPAANAKCREAIDAELAARTIQNAQVRVIDQRAATAMVASNVVLLASGTATLEALLAKRAMVVAYRMSPLTAWLVRTFKLARTDRFSLPNALAGEKLVPEAMQEDCTPENLATLVLGWLREPQRMAQLEPRFAAIHRELRRNASKCAAHAVAELIEQ
ncbi:MAG: lipid-A-disaccharide synthase [Lysobacteraceae bacterium]